MMRVTVLGMGLLLVFASCAWGQDPESRPAPPPLDLDKADPLDDLSHRMDGITSQLEAGQSGPKVQGNQSDVIGQLDALIAALKKKSGS
jgi:hypothetical protein